jgi:hypothetical protein
MISTLAGVVYTGKEIIGSRYHFRQREKLEKRQGDYYESF